MYKKFGFWKSKQNALIKFKVGKIHDFLNKFLHKIQQLCVFPYQKISKLIKKASKPLFDKKKKLEVKR